MAPASEATMTEIYALVDPRDGDIRYIGKANNAAKRLKTHLLDSRRRDTPVYRWIRKLASMELAPAVRVLVTCDKGQWQSEERRLITALRPHCRLLNVAEGGDEPFCPTETRAANGRRNAASRSSTPLKRRVWELKREIGARLKSGEITESQRAKLRLAAAKAPHMFGQWAAV
jgi:hypothetical protein